MPLREFMELWLSTISSKYTQSRWEGVLFLFVCFFPESLIFSILNPREFQETPKKPTGCDLIFSRQKINICGKAKASLFES